MILTLILRRGLQNLEKLSIYWTLISALVWKAAYSLPCPIMCSCLKNKVNCADAGLSTIPVPLPPDTQILNLMRNKMKEFDGILLANVSNLSELYLDSNLLTSIRNLRYLRNLKVLSLSRNFLTNASELDLPPMIMLETLDVSYNSFTIIPENLFGSNNVLTKLDLSYNSISDISGLATTFRYLAHLNLNHNKISNVSLIRSNPMENLKTLRLAHNKIKELVSVWSEEDRLWDTHDGFSSLEYLDLSDNEITQVEMFLSRFLNLKKLFLSSNKLQWISGGSFLRNNNLEELYLDGNLLVAVTNMWFNFKSHLKYLDLSRNSIKKIDDEAFLLANNVKYIDLSSNQLESIEDGQFQLLRNLSYLNLHNNNIRTVRRHAFRGLNSLVYLNLSRNFISLGERDLDFAFEPLKTLKILDLSDNAVRLIPNGSFRGLRALSTLYLRANEVLMVEDGAFEELDGISNMYFETRSLLCDCSAHALRNWLKDRSLQKGARVFCGSPRWLKGKEVVNILDSELICTGFTQKALRPKIVINPRSQEVRLYGNATLLCVASSSEKEIIEITWYKGGQRVSGKRVVSDEQKALGPGLQRSSSWLHFDEVGFRDAGSYRCVAANSFGSDWSPVVNISVVVLPYFTMWPPKEAIARSGDSIDVPCSAKGLPVPTIQFMRSHGGSSFPAVDEKRVTFRDDHKFGIEHLKVEDSGVYTCLASNSVGSANASILLTVIEKPKFSRPLKSQSVRLATTVVLDCSVTGNPRPKITWSKDGKELLPDSAQTSLFNQLLVLVSFERNDAGLYSCQATNSLGTVTQSAELTALSDQVAAVSYQSLPTPVFVTVIVLTVVSVIIMTSLVWLVLLCFCRRRRRCQSKSNAHCELLRGGYVPRSAIEEDSLLKELPRQCVLKHNGRLVAPLSDSRPAGSNLVLVPDVCDVRNYLLDKQTETSEAVVEDAKKRSKAENNCSPYLPLPHNFRIVDSSAGSEEIMQPAPAYVKARENMSLCTAAIIYDSRVIPTQGSSVTCPCLPGQCVCDSGEQLPCTRSGPQDYGYSIFDRVLSSSDCPLDCAACTASEAPDLRQDADCSQRRIKLLGGRGFGSKQARTCRLSRHLSLLEGDYDDPCLSSSSGIESCGSCSSEFASMNNLALDENMDVSVS